MADNTAEIKPISKDEGANATGTGNQASPGPRATRFTAPQLMGMVFPEPNWAIHGLVPEGLGIVAGPPKIGKSWLLLQTCLAVSSGVPVFDRYQTEPGRVLYLALEDTPRRLQSRLLMMGETDPSEALEIRTHWERFPKGLQDLRGWLNTNAGARLIVIDTWTKVKPAAAPGQNVYHVESEQLSLLKNLADEFAIPILVVHHLKKGASTDEGDWIEQLSGSMGMSGTPDTIWHVTRPRGDPKGTWRVTGRDIDEQELAATFDSECGKWIVEGAKDEVAANNQQSSVLEFLRENGLSKPADVATGLGIKPNTARQRLRRLLDSGKVLRNHEDKYGVKDGY